MGYIFDALQRAGENEPSLSPRLTGGAGGNGNERLNAQPSPPTEPIAERPSASTPEPAAASVTPPAPTPDPPLRPRSIMLSPHRIRQMDDRLVALTRPSAPAAEEYRAMRTSLLARWQHARHLAHVITSATPQEGKTITALNLGLSLAELHNRSVVVVEADLRMPTFAKLLGLTADENAGSGLIAYLQGEAPLAHILHQLGEGLVFIRAGGQAHEQAVQLLSSQRMASLIDILRRRFDHVILDTPPVLELADAGIVGALADEVMLVARMGWTPRPLVYQAACRLAGYNAKLAGVIATDQRRNRRTHAYRYGTRYAHNHTSHA